MNIFLQDYYSRLRGWHELKETLKNADIETICIEVDRFWQRCPMSNHYLHPVDVEDWPSPWELLNENNYCLYARALGMVYTLLHLGIKDIDLIAGSYYNTEDVVLLLVNDAKYTLNWYPNSVLNTTLSEFTNIRRIDITPLQQKTGKE